MNDDEMKSRERVLMALNHMEPDRVPLDLGGSAVTGMHVSTVYALRQALKLDPPGTPVKVIEPYQMLGEIGEDLRKALGVDVIELGSPYTMFGFKKEKWKQWKLPFDGTPVLVPEGFNTEPSEAGEIFMYPQGDKTVPPCAKMPKNGYFFDAIDRQEPIDWKNLKVEDNIEEFKPISNEELEYYRNSAEELYQTTDYAIFVNFGGTSFGDIALVPGLNLKHPRGVRGVKEWYMCLTLRPDFIGKVFEKQCEIALENLEKIYKVVKNRVQVVFVSGTDFGTQSGPIMSKEMYRKLFKPYHKRVNSWIHEHTEWKTFIHSCGSVEVFIEDFIDAGFDILNPVQTSAKNMGPSYLKTKYGNKIVFWGGGIETQKTLPFGTPEQVRKEVIDRIKIFGPKGGFVFNTIHNVLPKVPVENILTMYKTVREFGMYPIK
ncbi:MAG: uroporphyrinogen decarboxylase family protein [Nitrososphaeria archaeon]